MSTIWEKRSPLRLALAAALCLALAALTSCRPGRATVTGKVTLNGQPLTGGTVAFVGSPNVTGSGQIKPDGTYTVSDAPVGDVTITVGTPVASMGPMSQVKPPPGMGGMPAEMRPPGDQSGTPVNIVPAPDKYKSAETSPLKFTVQRGSQTYDIDLKP